MHFCDRLVLSLDQVVAMVLCGGMHAPQFATLPAAGLRSTARAFGSVPGRHRAATPRDARDRSCRKTVSSSSSNGNGRLPSEQGGPVLNQLNGDAADAREDASGARTQSSGANGAFSLDSIPAGLNGSNGSEAVSRPPRLVGTYDSDGEDEPDALGARILGGEYTDAGSTKAKLTEPVRRVLSKGLGPGELQRGALHDESA